jgi:hypothetical protein
LYIDDDFEKKVVIKMYNYSDLTPISTYTWDIRKSGIIQKNPINMGTVGDDPNDK